MSQTDNKQESNSGFPYTFPFTLGGDDKEPKIQSSPISQRIIDSAVLPCFGVENVANSFVQIINETSADDKNDNFRMLGIFAPWGRGKTYFFRQIEKILESSPNNKKYTSVTFNAWKYQKTPALWAYLYETMNKCLLNKWLYSSLFRFESTVKGIVKYIVSNWVLVLVLFTIAGYMYYLGQGEGQIKTYGLVGLSVLAAFKFYSTYSSIPVTAAKIMDRFNKRQSFLKSLGLQNDIEAEIRKLLKFYTSTVKVGSKVVLYVDDLDRCSHEKMVHIIESLRTVLEDSDIRERLIVVVSVDAGKLKAALRIKYKTLCLDVTSNVDLDTIVREQFDKLFLAGIALPKLTHDQADEYLDRLLYNDINNSPLKSDDDNGDDALRTISEKMSEIKNEGNDVMECSRKVIKDILFELVEEYNVTPRQLRIVYYRMILANNLIHNTIGKEIFDRELLTCIFTNSLGVHSELAHDYVYIQDMVVPY